MVNAEPCREMIYVVSFMGYHKIGRTSNIQQRMRSILPTAFPIKPSLELLLEVPDSRTAESIVHAELSDKRVHGEWFKLDDSDVGRISETIRSIDYSRHRLRKTSQPKTVEYLSQIVTNKIALESGAVPLKYACGVLCKLKAGRSVPIATNNLAILRSIERKFGLKLWFAASNCNLTHVTRVS